jgi:hypothetical protein
MVYLFVIFIEYTERRLIVGVEVVAEKMVAGLKPPVPIESTILKLPVKIERG